MGLQEINYWERRRQLWLYSKGVEIDAPSCKSDGKSTKRQRPFLKWSNLLSIKDWDRNVSAQRSTDHPTLILSESSTVNPFESLKLAARVCARGQPYSVNHCLTCKRGDYMIIRHNSIRDLFAELISEICKDVVTEPPLLPLTGETLPAGSNLSDGARLDITPGSYYKL